MCHLWEDKGYTWSVFAWKWITSIYPEQIFPGMVACHDGLLNKIPSFYASVLRAFALINCLKVSVKYLCNIWASSEYPGISVPMVMAGYIEVGVLPVLNGILDFQTIQQRVQAMGFMDNIFLLYSSLQMKFKLQLGRPCSMGTFPCQIYKEAKKLLQTERQFLFDLSQWELLLGPISFVQQQNAFKGMLHSCKIIKFFEINLKILHHTLATPSLIAKICKDKPLE